MIGPPLKSVIEKKIRRNLFLGESNPCSLCVFYVTGTVRIHAERWNTEENKQWRWNKRMVSIIFIAAFIRLFPACVPSTHACPHIQYVAGIGNSPIIRQWSGAATIAGLADKTLMYRALCSLCWDSIRLPNSRACLQWDGGVRALSYGPSGAASLHSVCLILVSQPQGEAHCQGLPLTELTHFICFFLSLSLCSFTIGKSFI